MQCKDNNFQEEKKKNRIIFKFGLCIDRIRLDLI